MTWLVVILAIAGLAVGAVAGLAVQVRRDRDRRLEVVPGVRSDAPAAWAGSHTAEARLHRRLGDAVRSMQGGPSQFAAPRAALEQEALRIDARLVAAAGLTGPRRATAIAAVEDLVARYEAVVAELVTTSVDTSALDAVIEESAVKLQALEAARAEVERIDREQSG